MARSDKLRAIALAEEHLRPDLEARGAESYVRDHGPRYAFPKTRFEAGVLAGIGTFGFRTNCVYGATWGELCDALEALPARRRFDDCASWRLAAFDALAAGADPVTVRTAAHQLASWVEHGSEASL